MNPKAFRSLDEVKTYLNELATQFQQDSQMADKAIKQMAKVVKAVPEVKILDISGDGKLEHTRAKKTLNVDFPIVKVPNVKDLQRNYRMAERLSEQYKSLLNVENAVKMDFKNVTSTHLENMLGNFTKLKGDMERKMRELFSMLHEVAQKHAPKEYLAFVKSLATELETNAHIECDSIDTKTYVGIAANQDLIFAGYIILTNSISDEGKIAPHLYITIKWTVGGNVEVFVEHEFIPPTLLGDGTVVNSIRQAARTITNQLTLEGFSAQIGNLPVSMQIREPVGGLRREAFSAAPFITKVSAEKDALVFELVQKVSAQQLAEIKAQLFMEVKALLKKKRGTKVRMGGVGNFVTFHFADIDQSQGINPHDLDFLAERYHLNDTQVRKLVNTING